MYVCVCTCVCTWVDVLSMHGPARLTPTPPINLPPTPRPHNTLNPPLNPFHTMYIYIHITTQLAGLRAALRDRHGPQREGRHAQVLLQLVQHPWGRHRPAPHHRHGYVSIYMCMCCVCVGMWGSGADGTDGRGGPIDQSSRHCPSTHPDGTSNQSLTPSQPHTYHQPYE